MEIKVKKVRSAAKLPTQSYDEAMGYDLYACLQEPLSLFQRDATKVTTGIAVEPPKGYGFIIKERSGLGSSGSSVRAGVIDSSFRGEVIVILQNLSNNIRHRIYNGDKIAQMILVPVPRATIKEVKFLSETERGDRGFGSSDKV